MAVHAAKGATLLSHWEKDSETGKERYAKTIEKIAENGCRAGERNPSYFLSRKQSAFRGKIPSALNFVRRRQNLSFFVYRLKNDL